MEKKVATAHQAVATTEIQYIYCLNKPTTFTEQVWEEKGSLCNGNYLNEKMIQQRGVKAWVQEPEMMRIIVKRHREDGKELIPQRISNFNDVHSICIQQNIMAVFTQAHNRPHALQVCSLSNSKYVFKIRSTWFSTNNLYYHHESKCHQILLSCMWHKSLSTPDKASVWMILILRPLHQEAKAHPAVSLLPVSSASTSIYRVFLYVCFFKSSCWGEGTDYSIQHLPHCVELGVLKIEGLILRKKRNAIEKVQQACLYPFVSLFSHFVSVNTWAMAILTSCACHELWGSGQGEGLELPGGLRVCGGG